MESALLYNYRQKGHNAFKLRLRPYKNRFAKKKKRMENGRKKKTRNKKQNTTTKKGGGEKGRAFKEGEACFSTVGL